MNTKFYFVSALASMALLSGCSDNELASVETSQKTPIGFHTVGSQMGSRATIINSGTMKSTDFRVFAFTKNDADDNDNIPFMGHVADENGHKGVTIKYFNSNWDYANASDSHYWPETPLNFYAISPATFNYSINYSWNITKDSKTITYQSFDEYANTSNPSSLDLMYAVTKNQKKSTTAGKVNLQFKHILSQIVFQAKTKYDNMKVEIKDVYIHNVYRKGTFTFPSSTELSQSNWAIDNAASAYGAKTYIVKDKNIVVKDKNTAEDISSENPSLFIPQELTAWKPAEMNKEAADAAKHSYLEINCRIQQNGVYVFGKAGYTTLFVPFYANWQPGKRYVYTLIFGGGYDEDGHPILSPINFEATAEDWVGDTNNTTNGNDVITQ